MVIPLFFTIYQEYTEILLYYSGGTTLHILMSIN